MSSYWSCTLQCTIYMPAQYVSIASTIQFLNCMHHIFNSSIVACLFVLFLKHKLFRLTRFAQTCRYVLLSNTVQELSKDKKLYLDFNYAYKYLYVYFMPFQLNLFIFATFISNLNKHNSCTFSTVACMPTTNFCNKLIRL